MKAYDLSVFLFYLQKAAQDLDSALPAKSSNKLLNALRFVSHNLLEFLKYSLPLALLCLKFVEWWYANPISKRAAGVNALPVPPPPEPVEPDPEGTALPQSPLTCPICLKQRTNPAVLPSGYTYCYPCAFRVVQESGCCPVTGWACTTEEIRKIFDVGS